ncbi:hypothetical protein [Mycobacteroides abscessus]|uniref:hypothetical protein n=1 Tax=Mycobacteroides abscessus TaxID=36809 RepID=UPI0021033FE1|nr:hypothetical protein [Mycobacteroides abscessus]
MSTDHEAEYDIAATILMQLAPGATSGNLAALRLNKTVGARGFLILGDGVSFQIMRNPAKLTHVSITLTPADTYRVRFGTLKGVDYNDRKVFDDVHVEQLRETFESTTGLFLTIV